MAHRLTKHRPGVKDQQPPVLPSIRTVEVESAHRVVDSNEDYVSLGTLEPQDGRYVSLVRSTFRHATVKPHGEVEVSPAGADELSLQKKQRSLANREKQFYLGPSEAAVQVSIDRARHTPSPSVEGSIARARQDHAVDPEESKKNATAMRACHVYVSTADQDAWKSGSASLMRTDIGKNVDKAQAVSAKERSSLRDGQRQTHFSLGTFTEPITSESRGCYRGTATERTLAIGKLAAKSTLQLGISTVDVKDMLRSLKQVDFVRHDQTIVDRLSEKRLAAASKSIVVNAETDSLVLGYNDEHNGPAHGLTSLYRSSYTPISFSPSPQRNHSRASE